jgi:uncharacterized surface protein with fasciclin (FAS1) repeats
LDVLIENGDFTTLSNSAFDGHQPDHHLEGEDPITLFAPFVSSFDELPNESLERLHLPELTTHLEVGSCLLLRYHVLDWLVNSTKLNSKVNWFINDGEYYTRHPHCKRYHSSH